MERHGPEPDYDVADESQDEDRCVGVQDNISDPLNTQVDEDQVCHGVDKFCTVVCDVVVLFTS